MKLRLVLALLLCASTASAQILPVPGGFKAARQIRYGTTAHDLTALTTYTFAGMSYGGGAATGRIIVVACSGANANRTISSATIGGVAASKEVEVVSATNGTAAILTASVGSGTSGDVVITWSGAQIRSSCSTWSMYGVSSGTAANTRSDGTPAGSNLSLNATANDILVVATYINTGSLDVATGFTVDFNTNPTAGVKWIGGSAYVNTTESPRSVAISYTGSPTVTAAVAAVFR